MAEICPFRGIRYNQEIVKDLATVICPPYDIITPEQQRIYYKMSDYNAIRLEYAIEQPGDDATDNKYTRTAVTFQQWLKEGVLQVEGQPAFYLHDHFFTYLGDRKKRRALITRFKLQPWYSGIFPHEETGSEAKSDRLQLMRACRASFSGPFGLYQDVAGDISRVLSESSKAEPVIDIEDANERHVVWMITQPEFVRRIGELMRIESVYIADGHHRYETALTYQQERTRFYADRHELSGDALDYVMMTLVSFADPGLVISPVYRLLHGVNPSILTGLQSRLEKIFSLEYVPLTDRVVDDLRRGILGGAIIGILGLQANVLVRLWPRQGVSLEDEMPKGFSQAYTNFNVSILDHLILGKMLKLKQENGSNITYTDDLNEVLCQIKDAQCQIAFALTPAKPGIIKAITEHRERMPRKSTYFYPKLPTGLVFNPLI